ncbi:MAG: hypothetical protein ABI193_23080 [Minicystis sp.]
MAAVLAEGDGEPVAGPLHARASGPNPLDPTFGPEVRFERPSSAKRLRLPHDEGQYFGAVTLDGQTEVLTVAPHDLRGTKLHETVLQLGR